MEQHRHPLLSLQTTNSEIILRRISFLLIGIVAVFFSLREIYGEDIPFHLNAGRWIIENLSFPDKDTFTYTASEHQYIDMNWLYQIFMYGVYSAAGAAGLILMNSLFLTGSIFLLFKRASGNSSVFLPWLFLIAVIAVSPILEIRPHSVSWLFLSLVFYILQQYEEGNRKIIRWLPVVMLLWVNCHSLFILGLVVTGCYGVSIAIKQRELLKEFFLWAGIAALVCFINPYGWQGVAFPFEQVLSLQAGDVFKENIRELQSPFKITEYELTLKNLFLKWHFFDLFILIAGIGLIRGYNKIKIHEWLISIIFFYFAYTATKNIGYFIFAITPIIANCFLPDETGTRSDKKNKNKPTPFLLRYSRQISIFFIVICTVLLLSIRSNAFYIQYKAIYRFGLGWSEENLPVKATDFLVKNKLNGRLLNQLDLGGYLGFFTRQKVAIDGRLEVMGKEMFAEQEGSFTPEAKSNLIAKYKPEIIIFSYYITPEWISYFVSQADWRLVYLDGSHAIYLKNSYAPDIKALDEATMLASASKQHSDTQIDEIIRKKKKDSFLSSLFLTQYYPDDELNKAFFFIYYSWGAAAKQVTVSGFEKATCGLPELFQNLGTIYYQYKDKDRALFCYEKYLETNRNEHVEKRVQFLKSL